MIVFIKDAIIDYVSINEEVGIIGEKVVNIWIVEEISLEDF